MKDSLTPDELEALREAVRQGTREGVADWYKQALPSLSRSQARRIAAQLGLPLPSFWPDGPR